MFYKAIKYLNKYKTKDGKEKTEFWVIGKANKAQNGNIYVTIYSADGKTELTLVPQDNQFEKKQPLYNDNVPPYNF